jgi:hypothetical protein
VAPSADAAPRSSPKAKAQHNFTDPESRIMKGPDGFVQAYNAQAAVEPALQLIVGQALTQQVLDKQQLIPIIEPIFGQIKQAHLFRHFLLRGVDNVRSEWALVCATHNVLKLYQICTA